MRRLPIWIALIPFALIVHSAAGQGYTGPPGLSAFEAPAPGAGASAPPPTPTASSFWIRGQYLAWGATTREGLEAAEENTASRLFEGVLAFTGASRDDLEEAAIRGRYGVRLAAGFWADPAATFGYEVSATYLDRRPLEAAPVTSGDLAGFSALTAGVVLPGLSGQGGGTVVVPLAAGNLATGSLRFELGDQTFLDLQALGRARLAGTDSLRLDGLIGARRLEFEERLGVTAQMTALAPPLLVGSTVTAGTRVESRAVYCGALVGLDWSAACGCWEIGVRPTVTFARVENRITRQAFGRATVPGVGDVDLVPVPLFPGGLGSSTTSDWTFLPELDVRLAYQVFSHVRVVAGAGVLLMPSVVRASGQLDLGLPVSRVVPGVSGVPLAGLALTPDRDTLIITTASLGIEIQF